MADMTAATATGSIKDMMVLVLGGGGALFLPRKLPRTRGQLQPRLHGNHC